jgi:hypothetical protein
MKRYVIWTLVGASFVVVTLIALAGVLGTRPSEYVDPFTPFDNIAPGQPTSTLAWGICNAKYYFGDVANGGFLCAIEPKQGPFSAINVTAQDEEIFVVSFYPNDLQVGDLVYRWGRPDSVRHARRGYTLTWNAGVYATVRTRSWYTLASPVDYVSVRKLPASPIDNI